MFEEVTRTLLCSDLFTHEGDVEPIIESDILDRARESLVQGQKGPFADAYPYTALTGPILEGLAELRRKGWLSCTDPRTQVTGDKPCAIWQS